MQGGTTKQFRVRGDDGRYRMDSGGADLSPSLSPTGERSFRCRPSGCACRTTLSQRKEEPPASTVAPTPWKPPCRRVFHNHISFQTVAYVVRQTVISTGPYRYVRHPMYATLLIFVPGTALLLGSWYGLLLGLALVGMVARRAALEERTLREELAECDEYMARVRYRLVPSVW